MKYIAEIIFPAPLLLLARLAGVRGSQAGGGLHDFVWLFAALISYGGEAWGQTRLNEQQAVELALLNHPSIQKASLLLQEQTLLKGTAKAWEPAEIFHNIAADPDYGMFGTTALGVSQAFPGRKTTQAHKLYFEKRRIVAEAGLNLSKQQLAKTVRELYQHLSFIQSEAGLYRRLDSLYREVSEIAQRRYLAGEVALSEKLVLQDKAAQVRMALETTGHEIEFDRVVLGQLLGLPGQVEPLMEPFHRLSFSLADTAFIENSAESVFSRSTVDVAEAERVIEQAKREPTFAGGLFMQYLPNGQFLPGWQVSVRVPLASKHLKAGQEAAAVRTEASGAAYRAELLKQRNQMAHLLHEQEKYEILLNYYDNQGKSLAGELLRNALLNYRSGEIGFVELTQVAEQVSAIELGYLENLFKLNLTVLELRYLTGR